MFEFLPFIQRAHTLQSLSIRSPTPPLFEDGSKLLDAFATALYINSSIQKLYLEGNAIGSKGVYALLRASNNRRKRCALQELSLLNQRPILPTSVMDDIVERSKGNASIITDTHNRILNLPFLHNEAKKPSLLERQVRSPGAVSFVELSNLQNSPSLLSSHSQLPSPSPPSPSLPYPSNNSKSSNSKANHKVTDSRSNSVISKTMTNSKLRQTSSSSFSSSSSSSSSSKFTKSVSQDVSFKPKETKQHKEPEPCFSTIKSGAQRGRSNLPHEIDARTIDFENDVEYAKAANDAIRNNSTKILF
mmetsp:Transcript_19784/g.25814  ORF Transcript_19784/g.25814 Transcript_19784/m.25814 type:complete len:303 (+) Transcript_19784:133-1041(+)